MKIMQINVYKKVDAMGMNMYMETIKLGLSCNIHIKKSQECESERNLGYYYEIFIQ
jgi:hypothetical protein